MNFRRQLPATPITDDSSSDLPLAVQFLSTQPRRRRLLSDSDSSSSDDDAPLISLASYSKQPSKLARLLESSSSDDSDDEPILKPLKRGTKRRLSGASDPFRFKRIKPNEPRRRSSLSIAERLNPASDYKKRDVHKFVSEKGSVKWWQLEPRKDDIKWERFDHNGVVFPPEYTPHGIKMTYDGVPLDLTPDQEEIATWFAAILETDHAQNPTFCKNFFADWRRVLISNRQERKFPQVQDLKKCNFRPIHEWLLKDKEKKKELRKDAAYKQAKKEEKKRFDELYGMCLVDGILEKVGNFKVEPPGLFRGRGAHPKTGMIKKRLQPEDIILNIGRDIPIPKCPVPGHDWGGIIHDPTVTYLAKWTENINGLSKFVHLHSSSRFKGQADIEKYDKARRLKKHIGHIRRDYTRKLVSTKRSIRQLATAVWMIDILAIRVGNEKDTEETADTVGVCSLRKEHVELFKETQEVALDFLGKDSMRYYNKTRFPDLVFANIELFVKNKRPEDQLFDDIDPSLVNTYFQTRMKGLTAKVFRTYNASITLQRELDKAFDGSEIPEIGNLDKDSSIDQKVFFYDQANKQVAILCNHQKSVSKSHDEQMEKLTKKIEDRKTSLERLEQELLWATGKRRPRKSDNWRQKSAEQVESQIKKTKSQILKYELQQKLKADNKEVALGTSKINYMDPRITVGFCKKVECPLEKVFSKSLVDKFPWACTTEPSYQF